MIELFIEGHRADISQEFSTLMTYCIDDIKDFSARNTSFSKTIILPGTNNNNKLFGNVFEINGSNYYDSTQKNLLYNFNPSISARAVIFSDNIQLFKGVLKIGQIIIDKGNIEYEVNVFGELSGLMFNIGAKLLTDLDFSAYDHTYDIGNISTSWSNLNAGYGYYYPLIDYGTYSTNKHDWKYGTFRPAFFVKEILEKIISDSGYTVDAPIFSTDRFKSLINPSQSKFLQRSDNNILNVNNDAISWDESSYSDGLIPFANHYTMSDFTTTDDKKFNYSGAIGYTGVFNLHLTGSWSRYSTSTFFVVEVYKNLVVQQSFTIPPGTALSGTFDNTFTFNLVINTGDYIEVKVNPRSIGIGFTINIDAGSEMKFTIPALVKVPVNYGDTLTINTCLPENIYQKDYLSSIVKLFNLYIYEDTFTNRHIKIAPFADDGTSTGFYNAGETIDWIGKLDRSQPITIKPMAMLTSRYYTFKYKDDSDYWNDLYKKRYNMSYGSFRFDSGYQMTDAEESTEIIFSGSPLIGYAGEDKVYTTIYKRTGTSTLVEETTDSNLRILQAKKVTGVSPWYVYADDGTTSLGHFTYYPYAGHLDNPDSPTNDLCFGTPFELFFTLVAGALNINQFNVYWSSYMAEITDKDSKLLTCTMRLKTSDIFNLDFSKFIYIDGSLFRLVKIEDYNTSKEDICKVTLLKVINTQY